MSTKHQTLFKKAYQAINAVFSDQSISHKQTLESLELLRRKLDILIDTTGKHIKTLMEEPQP